MASGEQAAAQTTETGEVEQKIASLEEVGLESQREEDTEKGGDGERAEGEEPQGATAVSAPSVPQPPYDEDFNPFSEEDVQKILHEEESSDPKEGWKFVSRSEFSEIWRKSDPSKPVHLIKGFLQFPGIPPSVVTDLIHNTDRRKEWDKVFSTIEVVEDHKNFRVVYWVAKMPPTITDRDLVQFIRRQHDEATNTTFFLYRNATHPAHPEKKGLVRSETILSGVIVRPDPQDPNSTRLSILLQNDIKGWVPHIIVNVFAARSPKQWRDSLVNFYENVYSKELKGASSEAAAGEEKEGGDKGGEGKKEGGEGEKEEGEVEGEEGGAQEQQPMASNQ